MWNLPECDGQTCLLQGWPPVVLALYSDLASTITDLPLGSFCPLSDFINDPTSSGKGEYAITPTFLLPQ
jgi:hypothetical protein